MKIKYFKLGGQNSNDGVNKKLFNQVFELSQLGLDVELVLVYLDQINIEEGYDSSYSILTTHVTNKLAKQNIIGRVKRAHKICQIFGEAIDSLGSGDILYYRYTSSFPLYYPFKYLRGFRACKIVTEHQTIELDESKLVGSVLRYWSEFFFGKLIRKQSDAIIGVTDEITKYEIAYAGTPKRPCLTIGNGFAVHSVPVRHAPDHNSDEFHLLCVASVSRWHGLDRLLQGIATHNKMPRVILHIAGDGAELPHLQKLANDLGISDQVIFHGFLTGEALDALFDQCHIAVGSLGIHRKGLTQTSELKGREYCARGIPSIIACEDPDFPTDFPYTLHFPADESPIDLKPVLAFAKKVCTDPDHPEKMRRYAEEHLDWSVKMKKLKAFLEMLVGEERGKNAPELSTTPLAAKRLGDPSGTILSGTRQEDIPSGASRKRGR